MIPELVFVSMGWMALLASVGAVAQLDTGTRILSAVVASILWAVWGANALNIGVTTGADTLQSVEVVSLNYLGYLFAGILLLVAVYQTARAIRDGDTDGGDTVESMF